ncbi:regulatory protein TenI [Clostridium saccharobutylicum]|uniref:thiamine phosphate synthase n=1 Tax=Clostridium saccharobutylicum TaxID=169679 RepID=UPI0009838C10|nr:thiamine phosphate synthase [Clostridium saccharobutylicum]AQS10345.1 regulatory protein TenI [Clostridium saccharobutylicum]MBC2438275.1 thiamine phosphate synthase [Clostridium saccharobutylicum]OOM18146.1 regulatory protein TenI [Clostridium saccharobutylicum]
MYKLLSITNRHLCKNDFLTQIQNICILNEKNTMIKSVSIVLREKDLSENDYKKLAAEVLKVCRKNNTECILHTYYKAAKELNCRKIHLPLHVLKSNLTIYKEFDEVGVSIHSVNEAIEAMNLGATYITAGHIFATDCKKGVTPRGLDFLSSVCSSVNIPVYAIGGISPANAQKTIDVGAEGVCIMSGLMTCKNPELVFEI